MYMKRASVLLKHPPKANMSNSDHGKGPIVRDCDTQLYQRRPTKAIIDPIGEETVFQPGLVSPRSLVYQ